GTVAIIFAIRFVVLLVIRDEVIQCEAVMTRHIVYTLLDLAFFMTVNCGATEQAVSKPPDRPVFSTKKTPHIVAEPPVPLLPTVSDEATYLVKAGRVPRLGDELGSGERRVRFNVPQYRRIRHQFA